jgi:hypothetical protein
MGNVFDGVDTVGPSVVSMRLGVAIGLARVACALVLWRV